MEIEDQELSIEPLMFFGLFLLMILLSMYNGRIIGKLSKPYLKTYPILTIIISFFLIVIFSLGISNLFI